MVLSNIYPWIYKKDLKIFFQNNGFNFTKTFRFLKGIQPFKFRKDVRNILMFEIKSFMLKEEMRNLNLDLSLYVREDEFEVAGIWLN